MTEDNISKEERVARHYWPNYPAQCACGHLFMEKYEWPKALDTGVRGFCWCGFCRTRVNVYEH